MGASGHAAHRGTSGAARERPILVGEPTKLSRVAAGLAEAGARAVGLVPTPVRRVLGRDGSRARSSRWTGARREAVDVVVFGDRPNLDLPSPRAPRSSGTRRPGAGPRRPGGRRARAVDRGIRGRRRRARHRTWPAERSSASARTSTPTRSHAQVAAGYGDSGAREAPDRCADRAVPGQVLPAVVLAVADQLAAARRPSREPHDLSPLSIRLGDLVPRRRRVTLPRRPTSSSSGRDRRSRVRRELAARGVGHRRRRARLPGARRRSERAAHPADAADRGAVPRRDGTGQVRADGRRARSNVLFYRLGYAWILYEPGEVARMRDVVAMHARLGSAAPCCRHRTRSITCRSSRAANRSPARCSATMRSSITMRSSGRTSTTWPGVVAIHPRPSHRHRARRPRDGGRDRSGPHRDPGRAERRGGWSGELNAMAGVRMPNRPRRGPRDGAAPTVDRGGGDLLSTERGWFNQTLRGEIVMGAVDPDEPVGVNQRSSWAFLRRTAALMTRKAPALRDVTVIRQWAGMYDITPTTCRSSARPPSSTAGGRRSAGAVARCCSRRT